MTQINPKLLWNGKFVSFCKGLNWCLIGKGYRLHWWAYLDDDISVEGLLTG